LVIMRSTTWSRGPWSSSARSTTTGTNGWAQTSTTSALGRLSRTRAARPSRSHRRRAGFPDTLMSV
jgi:hypothetical protein